ncbi:MAG: hypothetical protein ICV85_13995 [Tolypothrix sp. T3-bin4]|nr:hypothetical protein [Tolypothrix sp. Co-bin9]MBD0303233.1 hypothetical protein [Tolypothrix sp. T3-bin4]
MTIICMAHQNVSLKLIHDGRSRCFLDTVFISFLSPYQAVSAIARSIWEYLL